MKVYLIVAVCTLVGGAYLAGGRIAREKCRGNVANSETNAVIKSVEITRIANEKTFNTGVRDIRDILRRKYTIAD